MWTGCGFPTTTHSVFTNPCLLNKFSSVIADRKHCVIMSVSCSISHVSHEDALQLQPRASHPSPLLLSRVQDSFSSGTETEDEGGSVDGMAGGRTPPSGGIRKARKQPAKGGSEKKKGGGAAAAKIDDEDLANMDPKKARRILKNREVGWQATVLAGRRIRHLE